MHLCKQESECQFYSNSKVRQMYQCCSGCNQICSKKKTAATTFLITGVIEGAFAAHEISKLREQRNKNHIDQKDYKREVTKTVSGAAGATVGSVGPDSQDKPFVPYRLQALHQDQLLETTLGVDQLQSFQVKYLMHELN